VPDANYRIALAILGLLAFLALLVAAVQLAGTSPSLAALSGGGALAIASAGLFKLLQSLGEK
jgi:hypothetical protein